MSTPYVGYSNDTLDKQPALKAGDFVKCTKCGGQHAVTETAPLLFFKCGATTFLAGVAGKSVMGIKADVRGRTDLGDAISDWPTDA